MYYQPSKSNNYFAIKLNTVWALFFADRVNFPFLSCLSGGQNKSGRTKVSNQSISGHSGQLLGTYMYILLKTIDHYNFPRDFNVQKIGFYLSQKQFSNFSCMYFSIDQEILRLLKQCFLTEGQNICGDNIGNKYH